MRGQLVCRSHGGASPQARQSARERLAELVEPALGGLHRALRSKDLAAIVRAATVVLDRAGYGPKSAMELSGPGGGPIEVERPIPLRQVSLDLRRALLAQIEAIRQGAPIPEYRVVAVSPPVPELDS
jgi:hypothetical protein